MRSTGRNIFKKIIVLVLKENTGMFTTNSNVYLLELWK